MRRRRWWVGAGLAAALAVGAGTGCGAAQGLDKLEDVFQVASGGLDPTLLGTFRLVGNPDPSGPVLRLLVLQNDRTFQAEIVWAGCPSDGPCPGTFFDGRYDQLRELPDPSRAAGVSLSASIPNGDDTSSYFRVNLRRAAVAESPLVGLFHPESVSLEGTVIPFFQMSHPTEMWCRAASDCSAQVMESSCAAWTCRRQLCLCQ